MILFKHVYFFTLFVLLISCNKSNTPGTESMNILFINDEDLTTTAVGCYGNSIVKTPYLDSLAADGILFSKSYCSAPMCNPSRAAFNTGLRPESTNILTNQDIMDKVSPSYAVGIAEILKQKEAYLVNIGKLYHGRDKNSRYLDFDRLEYCPVPEGFKGENKYNKVNEPCENRRFTYSGDSVLEAEMFRRRKAFDKANETMPSSDPRWWFEVGIPYIGFYFQLIGDSGIPEECDEDYKKARVAGEIIKQCAAHDKQFFISLGFSKPHTPIVAPKKYVDLYNPEEIELPYAKPENDRNMPPAAKRFGAKADIFTQWFDEEFPQLAETPQRQKEAIAAYYAAASFIDAQVGYVVDVLKETGQYDNTIIIFFADHGFHLGEHGLWSKYSVFEEATRVPLIIRVPGAASNGSTCNEIVELVDILPTICDLWKIEKPDYFESTSFMPLFDNTETSWKKAAFTTFTLEGVADTNVIGYSMRTKDYRFTRWGKQGEYGYELYDIKNDKYEQNNVASQNNYASIFKELEGQLNGGWKASLPNVK